MGALRAAQIDKSADDAMDNLDGPFFLFLALEQLAAHAVDGLALLVHHVVVIDEVLAGGEILRLYGFLGRGDPLADHLASRWERLPPCRAAA